MHRIWAVAVNTIKQALRIKLALIFMVLLAVLLPTMGFMTSGDYTLKGRLQTFVSYGLSLTGLLLSLLTITISIYTVSSDIDRKEIFTVITKPIRRWQFLLGKLLGVLVLDVALLAVFASVVYAIAHYMPRFSRASQLELAEARNEFFTARKAIAPPEPDVSREVEQALKKLQTSGDMQDLYAGMSPEEVRSQIENVHKLAKRSADVGRDLLWEFENVTPRDPNGSIFVRFKYEVSATPADGEILSQWRVGDYRPYKYGTQSSTPLYPIRRRDPVRKFREIEVPADAASDDGYLAVLFYNEPVNRTSVVFPLEDGLEVLYKADSFGANYVRATLLILFRLVFLACLGILASTFLSFPVAALLCLVLFSTATISEFVVESFEYISRNATILYGYTLKPLIGLLPRFDKFNPTDYIVAGRLISWSFVARAALSMVCAKSLLMLALALIIFRRREIARIVV